MYTLESIVKTLRMNQGIPKCLLEIDESAITKMTAKQWTMNLIFRVL